MMKRIVLRLVTAGSLSFAPNPSHAQSLMSPCMRVCEPPARLNTQNCSCEDSTRTQTKRCALVCPNPDQKLERCLLNLLGVKPLRPAARTGNLSPSTVRDAETITTTSWTTH